MPELNLQNLENEFDIENNDPIEPEVVDDEFEKEWETETAIEDVSNLKDNIDRANRFLDTIQNQVNSGNFSARMMEVASQMINTITQASKVLIDSTNYNRYLNIREKLALLKEREVEIKQLKVNRPKNQNLIIASREDVLKLISNEQKNDEKDINN